MPQKISSSGLYFSPLVLTIVVPFLAGIALTNRYIFQDTNHTYLLLLMVLSLLFWGSSKIPKKLFGAGITIPFLLFIIYIFLRLNAEAYVEVPKEELRIGLPDVIDMVIFYALFMVSAFLFYKNIRLSLFLWYLVAGYVLMFIARNTLEFYALKAGYNLSPGFVLFTLVPFLFLRVQTETQRRLIPIMMLFGCVVWLALLGARTAILSFCIFYFFIVCWPYMIRTRRRFLAVFWLWVVSLGILICLYLVYVDPQGTGELEQFSREFFHKRLGTRAEIWLQVLDFVSRKPWWGYGTSSTSAQLANRAPNLYRDNIEAHSLYMELLLRSGIVGLLLFIAILFGIWKTFWHGRHEWAVGVSGAFLIANLFFCSTAQFMVFTWPIRSALAWIILGIGVGATLKAMKEQREYIAQSGAQIPAQRAIVKR